MRWAYILRIFLLGSSVGMVEAAGPGMRRAPSRGPNQFQGRLPTDALRCGPNALYMFLRAHDRPVLADSFFREVEPGDQGLSLAQLRDASTRYGVPAEIRRCTYQELVGGCTFPLVALLQRIPMAHTLPITLFASLWVVHLLITLIWAVPTLPRQRQVASDEQQLAAIFNRFERLQTVRVMIDVLIFGITLWALVSYIS